MKLKNCILINQIKLLSLSLGLGAVLLACASVQDNKPIKIDGSSTVYPISKAVADAYKAKKKDPVEITVELSGTTGGFRKFCEGKTDISDASRPINQQEISMCNRYNIRFIELPIAFDALTFAEPIITQNQPVAVHCTSGNRRTGKLLAAYLISLGETPDQAIERIQQARPTAELREPQIQFLHKLPQLLGV